MEKIILVNAVEISSQPSSSEINLDDKRAPIAFVKRPGNCKMAHL